ncbi:MAG: MobV family relaxase [Oscillospiraceae bacterium]
MSKAQYGILRFHKYKGPEIGQIEAHNERTKEKYASNPDIDPARKHLNYNLLTPPPKYRAEAERQIREAGCRTRKDSVRLVETLITASSEFFQGKSQQEIRAYFERALEFMKSKQKPDTIISAVVHMDEKTPHMHLCFVPLTEDGRLSAKDILGNKKKLTQWQDEYWSYMVKKYPDLERGESASETGRTHIPPRIFKQATRLHRLEQKLRELLSSINPMNAKRVREEILKILDEYIPGVAELMTKAKALKKAEKELKAEIAQLKKEANSNKPSVQRLLELEKKVQEQEELQRTISSMQQTLTAIPPEIIAEYNDPKLNRKETIAIE